MKTVGQYITGASSQLNDQYLGREFTRWNRAQVLTYFNGALREILSYKPDAFATEIVVQLQPGRKQGIESPYISISAVTSNPDGTLVNEADLDLLRAFAPYTCCAGEVVFDVNGNPIYRAKSYSIDPKDPKTFYVSPEVPTGLNPTVRANVIAPPVEYTLNDWDVQVPINEKYQENILDYMMGRAFDIDTESPMARSNADKHLSRFYQAMGAKYKVEAAFRAGNWNGQVGDGDPRARL